MTNQIVCDDCGEPIDQSQPHYHISGSLVQLIGDPPALTTVESAKQMHYHEEHLPESVLDPAPPVAVDPGFGQPAPEPTPEPEPEPPTPEPEPPHPDNTLPESQPVPDNTLPVPEEPVDPSYGIPETPEEPPPVEPPPEEPVIDGPGQGNPPGQGGTGGGPNPRGQDEPPEEDDGGPKSILPWKR